MIRYVIAVIFASAMMGVTMPAVGDAAAFNGEKQVDQQLATIEEDATSLLYNEDISAPSTVTPTRHTTVSFPQDSLTSKGISEVVFERDQESSVTHVTYYVEDRPVGQYVIDAPLTLRNSDTFSLEGDSNLELRLSLEKDDNDTKVVVIERRY